MNEFIKKSTLLVLAVLMTLQTPLVVLANNSETNQSNYWEDEFYFDDEFVLYQDYSPKLDLENNNEDDYFLNDKDDFENDITSDDLLTEEEDASYEAKPTQDEQISETFGIEILTTHTITSILRTGVTRTNANFRTGPGANYSRISVVNRSTNVRITGRSGNWYRVVVGNDTGWISRNSMVQTRQVAVVNTNNAHIRSGRGTGFRSLTRVSRGHRVTVARQSANWSRVTANGQTGWIRTSDLRVVNASRPGRTRTNNVRVHTAPNSSFAVLHRLPRHAQLMIMQRTTDGWTQIRVPHNGGTLSGWVRTTEIERRVQTRRLSRNSALRVGAGNGFSRIRTLNANTNVTIRSRVGSWYNVRTSVNGNRVYGWIHADNLPRLAIDSTVGAAALNPTWGVVYGSATMRRGPGNSYSSIRTLPNNTLIATILRRSGSWLEIRYSGQTGWIHHDFVRVGTTASTVRSHSGRTNVATDLRNGAGNNHSVIRRVNANATVTVIRQSGEWLQVRAGNDEGWVRESHVNTTTPGTTNISAGLRSGPGNNYSQTRRLPSGINVTIIRQQGQWLQIRADNRIDWINALYVNIRHVDGTVGGVTNRVGSEMTFTPVTGEAGLRLTVPSRRTIRTGSAFEALEGVRIEHIAENGTVTTIPITWHQASWSWRFTHNGRTFTVAMDGIMDHLTPGTYERTVVIRQGQSVVARGNTTVVVR